MGRRGERREEKSFASIRVNLRYPRANIFSPADYADTRRKLLNLVQDY